MRVEWKWLWAALLLLVASFIIDSGLLAYAMYVLLGVMIISRWLTREGLSRVTAERDVSRREAEIGDTVTVQLTVSNTGSVPMVWLLLEDLLPASALRQIPPRLKVKGRRFKLASLRPGRTLTMSYDVRCDFRGLYQIGPLLLESGDLFGLHRKHRVATEPVLLTVYPKVVPLHGYDIASRRPIGDIRLTHRLYEDPTRIAGVRRYEIGDPFHRVHWRATARTGELHSKVYEPTTLAGATLLLDFHRDNYSKRGEPYRSELAVTTAASLAHAVFVLGQPIGLATNGQDAAERLRQKPKGSLDFERRQSARQTVEELPENDRLKPLLVPTRRGSDQFQNIHELLARVELADGLTFADFVVEVTPRLPRDASVIAVLPDVSISTAMALSNLRQAGFAVSVVLILLDPDQTEKAYGLLYAQNLRDIRRVGSETELSQLCSQSLHRGNPYQVMLEV
jgi:uncharacterized repeat protein (TIGR01451 family)